MRGPTIAEKRFASARQRFLQESIEQFFEREFPRYFGKVVRETVARELVCLIDRQLPRREHLRPGQCVWNAVSAKTRPNAPNRELIPVILTLVDEGDIDQLVENGSVAEVASNTIARMLREAYEQGALLTMRDIGLLMGRDNGRISTLRKNWEKTHGQILPHPGSLQDFGSCISHKVTTVRKVVYERKDPLQVARETRHSQRAVDRYLKDFYRVRTAYEHSHAIDFVCHTTGLSERLVREYVQIIEAFDEQS